MTTTAAISGSIKIGSDANPVTIPISTTLPPATPGDLVFGYDLPAGSPPTNILNVSDFVTWATSQIGASDPGLPEGLKSLSVGVSHLKIDTSGIFELAVLIGSKDAGTGAWSSSWKPIDLLPFSFSELRLEVDYGPAKLAVSADAASGATSLSFADTLRIRKDWKVAGDGIAADTTISALTATGVTLSAATTAAIAKGAIITFTAP